MKSCSECYTPAMPAREFHSFKELAKAILPPEETLRTAWSDIQCACSPKPQGLKRKQEESEKNDAFERAITTLRRHFPTSREFREAIPDWSFTSSSEISKQPLYHFANKWEAYEQQEQSITARRRMTAGQADDLLVYRKHSSQPLSREELEERRRRKQQSREDRIRNERREE